MAESVVGPWARDKLERLGKYLHAYTVIMKKQRWCEGFHYIDAFAGPGEHVIRSEQEVGGAQQLLVRDYHIAGEQGEQREFLAGSPRVALDLQFPFTNYIFIERSPERVAALEQLKAEYGASRNICIRSEDCTKYLRDRIAGSSAIDWRKNRALAFLDPFGMQVGWSTIEALASTKSIEIFLNFPVGMAIQRLLRRQPERYTDDERKFLDEYFGSPDWKQELYRTRVNLFGDEEEDKIEDSGLALLNWYRTRLRSLFDHVSRAALIRNTRGGHLYYLLLATQNATGVKIANHILSAGEWV